jgi:hypothetical protein
MKRKVATHKRASYTDIDTDAETHEARTAKNEGPCDDR